MGKDLYDQFAQVRELYACAGDVLGFDVAKVSFSGSEEELARTAVSQPAIFALSMAAYTAASLSLPAPQAVIGHSLGEFAALCCAGAYSLEDGFRIIKARARVMGDATVGVKAAMYAIIGSDESAIRAACEEAGGFVLPANYNTPGQTVISGEEEPAGKAAEILVGQGAKAVRLSVSGAFHTALMEPAAQRFREEINGIAFHRTTLDFYSNVTGEKQIIEDYPAYFAQHMVSPVQFVCEVASMVSDGIDTCIEFGPKKNTAALVKKNARALQVYNVEDCQSLEACLQKLKGV